MQSLHHDGRAGNVVDGRACVFRIPVSYTHLDVYKRQVLESHDVLASIHPHDCSATEFLAVPFSPFSVHFATPFLQTSPIDFIRYWRTSNRMEFLEAPAFSGYVSGYLTDDEYRELQYRLAAAPEHGDVIPGTRRISEASLGRPKTWQRTKRRSASDLLLLPRRATNLADDALRQGRSFRPYAQGKASFEECR